MKPFLKKLALPLTLAFSLAACENASDIARKPDAVEPMIKDSISLCETGPVNGSETLYAARLREVLMETRTKDLETIKNAGLTVCLDQRLPKQTDDFLDSRIDGIFFNDSSKIVAIWDNGKTSGESGFFELTASDYGSYELEILADKINEQDLPAKETLMYAARYSCGKNCTTTRWKNAEDFDQDSIAKNPQLKIPPVKKAASPSS